jgi:predicted transcriptional regulator
MTSAPLETANRTDNVDTVIRIMTMKNKSSIVILNELKHPEGIITERDIVRRLLFESKDAKLTPAAAIMSSPLISLNDDAQIYDAAMIMSKHSIRRLPIVKNNLLLGIVTATDLIRVLYQENRKDGSLHAIARGNLPRNKKFFIWNFMEELCDKYEEALSKHTASVFKIKDFKSTELPIFTQSKPSIFQTLKEYELDKGFIKIEDDAVTITSKGLHMAKKPRRDGNSIRRGSNSQRKSNIDMLFFSYFNSVLQHRFTPCFDVFQNLCLGLS